MTLPQNSARWINIYNQHFIQNQDSLQLKTVSGGGITSSTTGLYSNANTHPVNQSSHGLSVGDVIRSNGTANQYTKAQADSLANAEAVGIVSTVVDSSNFIYTSFGEISTSVTGTAGDCLFLSPTTAGALATTEPSSNGQVSKPIGILLASGSKMLVSIERGIEIGITAASNINVTTTTLNNNLNGLSPATVQQALEVLDNGTNWWIEAPSNQSYSGDAMYLTYGESLVPGDIVYFKSDGKVWKADANGTSTYPAMGLALATASSGSNPVLLRGVYRDDTRYSFTVGGIVYLSTTAGSETQTQPSATDDVVQVLGIATHADRIMFNPSFDYMTHV